MFLIYVCRIRKEKPALLYLSVVAQVTWPLDFFFLNFVVKIATGQQRIRQKICNNIQGLSNDIQVLSNRLIRILATKQ